MKTGKREKINFETVNGGNYTIIPRKDISETNEAIKKAMKDFLKELPKKVKIKKTIIILFFILKSDRKTKIRR